MIILASGSPRRRELISSIFKDFVVIKSERDEVVTKTLPDEIVCELSLEKAEEVWDKVSKEGKLDKEKNVLLAADTLVFLDDQRMGKPKDENDAVRMLKSLASREHQVYTGVTVFWGNSDSYQKITFYEKTDVYFNDISDEDIKIYVESGEPMDKAGAYAIQGVFAKHIRSINGEYANVVGLPIARVYEELKKNGII